jgi:hypothetical protein
VTAQSGPTSEETNVPRIDEGTWLGADAANAPEENPS